MSRTLFSYSSLVALDLLEKAQKQSELDRL